MSSAVVSCNISSWSFVTLSLHLNLTLCAGCGLGYQLNSNCLGRCRSSIQATWPSHCSLLQAIITVNGHCMSNRFHTSLLLIWWMHCCILLIPRMFLRQQWWKPSNLLISFHLAGHVSTAYNSTHTLNHTHSHLVVLFSSVAIFSFPT